MAIFFSGNGTRVCQGCESGKPRNSATGSDAGNPLRNRRFAGAGRTVRLRSRIVFFRVIGGLKGGGGEVFRPPLWSFIAFLKEEIL